MSLIPIILIPARMTSQRFPNKPLALIHGKTLIERVWRIGKAVKSVNRVIIVTDDETIKKVAEQFGAEVCMTSAYPRTGTDRIAEAVDLLNLQEDLIICLQGDAVLTPPWIIEDLLETIVHNSAVQIATPAVRLLDAGLSTFLENKRAGSSTGTTVVFNKERNALYFSKNVIPRNYGNNPIIYRHIGVYAYRKHILAILSKLPQSSLEIAENLEQLRALENEIPIRVVVVDYEGRTHVSIDQIQDIKLAESIIQKEGELF
jgi:3-deoxy-manno-octulosonate cytidylyltransferase (CMP-KDO synthetase)